MSDNAALVYALIERKMKVTTAESCTGGLVASGIIDVPDASKVLEGAFVTYAERVKEELIGVAPEIIEKYGVVSEETAEAMARGAAKLAGADLAISTTGVAGPGGGTEEIPVGTVCFGYFLNGEVKTETMHFEGDRAQVRKNAADHALSAALKIIC